MDTRPVDYEMCQNHENGRSDAISFRAIAPAGEFVCWAVVILAVVLRLVNGAAVTDDQFAIQVGLVSSAAVAGVALRIFNWKTRRKLS